MPLYGHYRDQLFPVRVLARTNKYLRLFDLVSKMPLVESSTYSTSIRFLAQIQLRESHSHCDARIPSYPRPYRVGNSVGSNCSSEGNTKLAAWANPWLVVDIKRAPITRLYSAHEMVGFSRTLNISFGRAKQWSHCYFW